ncbi:MAG: LytTR family DNA-binding domain-containing protein, partial [Chthoniobacterales bacterium]
NKHITDKEKELSSLAGTDPAAVAIRAEIDEMRRGKAEQMLGEARTRVVHTGGSLTVNGTLSRLLERIDEKVFVRTNRTQAVNPEHVVKIGEASDGNLLLHLDEKLVVEASRRNSAEFRQHRAIL